MEVPPALLAPFGLLLLLIAVMPLTPPAIKHAWEKYYPLASLGLAAVVAWIYVTKIAGGASALAHTMADYTSFICLVGSLYVVAGGIHIKVRAGATPPSNVAFLALGAVIANIVGTTGASMLLIRPWLRMNQGRARAYHVVFFIFIVSNIGGALTPVADPPLFLGYLRGVPFFWLLGNVLAHWLVTLGAVLAVFYAIDRRSFRRTTLPRPAARDPDAEGPRFAGGWNVTWLLVISGAIFLPGKFFLREAVMLVATAASWWLTSSRVRAENQFSFGPVKEVAVLFIGIFVTMLPVINYLEHHGQDFHLVRPEQYFFMTGLLSSVLDNVPTYAAFFQMAQTTAATQQPAVFAAAHGDAVAMTRMLLEQQPLYVMAVSLGAVFFGAMTYIGNGPNFMVRSIAQAAGVPCPSFFGYVFKYSLPILLPILAVGGWWFLR